MKKSMMGEVAIGGERKGGKGKMERRIREGKE